MSSTSASIEWYALRSWASSGDQRARSLRVVAVIARDSILISISGIAGDGDVPKSDSKDGIVSVDPVPAESAPPATTESDLENAKRAPVVAMIAVASAALTTI